MTARNNFAAHTEIILLALAALLALPLALLPLYDALVLCLFAVLAMLALIDPAYGLYALVLSVPIQEWISLPGELSYTQASVLIAGGAWLLHTLAHPERRLRIPALLLLLLGFLWTLTLASLTTPYSRSEALRETARWTVATLAFVLTVNTIRNRRQAIWLVSSMLLAIAACALIGLYQFVTASGPESFQIAGGRFVRAYGTIGMPNSFAGYMNMGWPLAAALVLVPGIERLQRLRRAGRAAPDSAVIGLISGAGIVFGLSFAALLASFSRGGWVGALGGAAVLALAAGRRSAQVALIAGLGAVLVLALSGGGLLPEALNTRLSSITENLRFFDTRLVDITPENFAVVERMAQITAGWRMFLTYPLTGVGPGNYTPAYGDFANPPWYESRGHAHNYYVHILAEAGIIGGLAYGLILIGLLLQAWHSLRMVSDPIGRAIVVGCCGISASIAVHQLFENLHVLNMGIHLSAAWGLLVAATAQPQSGRLPAMQPVAAEQARA